MNQVLPDYGQFPDWGESSPLTALNSGLASALHRFMLHSMWTWCSLQSNNLMRHKGMSMTRAVISRAFRP